MGGVCRAPSLPTGVRRLPTPAREMGYNINHYRGHPVPEGGAQHPLRYRGRVGGEVTRSTSRTSRRATGHAIVRGACADVTNA